MGSGERVAWPGPALRLRPLQNPVNRHRTCTRRLGDLLQGHAPLPHVRDLRPVKDDPPPSASRSAKPLTCGAALARRTRGGTALGRAGEAGLSDAKQERVSNCMGRATAASPAPWYARDRRRRRAGAPNSPKGRASRAPTCASRRAARIVRVGSDGPRRGRRSSTLDGRRPRRSGSGLPQASNCVRTAPAARHASWSGPISTTAPRWREHGGSDAPARGSSIPPARAPTRPTRRTARTAARDLARIVRVARRPR